MISKRLKAISSFLSSNDKVVDIGCDHGYLGIYATKKNLVSKITLSDININALNQARNNINKVNLNIETILSNGLDNIDTTNINTVVISGMGTKTILDILSNKEKLNNIDKLIIQSNNNLDILRESISNMGYKLIDEITIYDKDIWYVICLFIKDTNCYINDTIIKYGLLKEDKLGYYEYLYNKYSLIYKDLPDSSEDKLVIEEKLKEIENLLKEYRRIFKTT